jgi:hypothetical protein
MADGFTPVPRECNALEDLMNANLPMFWIPYWP